MINVNGLNLSVYVFMCLCVYVFMCSAYYRKKLKINSTKPFILQ